MVEITEVSITKVIKRIPREFKKPVTVLVKEKGWIIKNKKDGIFILSPDGIHYTTIHQTPSDRKAIVNFKAFIKRVEISY